MTKPLLERNIELSKARIKRLTSKLENLEKINSRLKLLQTAKNKTRETGRTYRVVDGELTMLTPSQHRATKAMIQKYQAEQEPNPSDLLGRRLPKLGKKNSS